MRKGKRTWITRHEAISSSWMGIWNAKYGGNMYSNFEIKIGALSEVHFRQSIYRFETLKVRSNALNGVQIGAKTKKLWLFEDNYAELKDYFEMILKFNSWIKNPIWNDPNFRFTHCHIDISSHLLWELHLGHFIRPEWAPHD